MIDSGAFILPGPAGRIEAIWDRPGGSPSGPPPRAAAVVCHPHPLYGGSMHNKVTYRVAHALADAGVLTLRFNFRGVGLSEGSHDQGEGEVADTRFVLDQLGERYPELPRFAIGYSFGAWVALRAAGFHPGVAAMAGIGIATRFHSYTEVLATEVPTLLIQGSVDALGPLAEVQALAGSFRCPPRLEVVPGADHFFASGLDQLSALVADFAQDAPPTRTPGVTS